MDCWAVVHILCAFNRTDDESHADPSQFQSTYSSVSSWYFGYGSRFGNPNIPPKPFFGPRMIMIWPDYQWTGGRSVNPNHSRVRNPGRVSTHSHMLCCPPVNFHKMIFRWKNVILRVLRCIYQEGFCIYQEGFHNLHIICWVGSPSSGSYSFQLWRCHS